MPFFKHFDNNSDITNITFNDRKKLGPMDKVSQRIMRGKLPFSSSDRVIQSDWSDKALYHVILVGCLFNFYNRLLDGHGIKGNQYIYQFRGEHLHKKGMMCHGLLA